VLHLLTLQSRFDIYLFVKNLWNQRYGVAPDAAAAGARRPYVTPLWRVRNKDGYTPLTLAAKEGNAAMFSSLLEEEKELQWAYGAISCFMYPLRDLDLPLRGEKDEDERYMSALEIIVKEAHLALLTQPRILDLLKQKWDAFAKRIFFQRFAMLLSFLLLFTYTTVRNQTAAIAASGGAGGDGDDDAGEGSRRQMFAATHALPAPGHSFWYSVVLRGMTHATETPFLALCNVVVVLCALVLCSREVSQLTRLGLRNYFRVSGSMLMENVLSLILGASIALSAVCRVQGWMASYALLSLASVVGWTYVLFFLLAFKLTGPMVVMIYQMLQNDVLRFLIVYSVLLAGFSQAFFVLLGETGGDGLLRSIRTCFLAMLGDFDLEQMGSNSAFSMLTIGLLVSYVIVISILLVNLLIAMMGDTYSNVNEAAEQQWHLERARIVMSIERRMTPAQRRASKYWVQIGSGRFHQLVTVDDNHFKKSDSSNEEKDS
jgi:hypothetical protein